MTDFEDIDGLAAEYVLGTLDGVERAAVDERRLRDPVLATAITAWEQRIGPMAGLVPPIAAPPAVWSRIEAEIGAGGSRRSDPPAGSNVVALEAKVRRWRRMSVAATAIAASVMVAAGLREYSRWDMPRNYVAVFQKDDASPAFLLSVDLDTRRLTIRSVAAQPQQGKSYQLWIAAAETGGKPRSLGLIEDRGLSSEQALAAFSPAVVQNALFGVSLEPAGGSPTGQPTGPVFHARLIQATP